MAESEGFSTFIMSEPRTPQPLRDSSPKWEPSLASTSGEVARHGRVGGVLASTSGEVARHGRIGGVLSLYYVGAE